MSSRVSLLPRDLSLLRLLSWTPATTTLLWRGSTTLPGGAFLDERRLRERLQVLAGAGMVRAWPMAQGSGGLQNYYKLTPLGFEVLAGKESELPSRAFFAEVSPALFVHTFRLADVIVETLRACHRRGVVIERFIRENELTFTAGDRQVQPDCFFRLTTAGQSFNLAFEIDNSMASVDAQATNSIRQKLTTYHAYVELVLAQWHAGGRKWKRPRIRVIFLTPSQERAYHILSLAAETTPNRSRRLVYAATLESYLTDEQPLHDAIFLDHFGHWHSLIDLHPTALCLKAPVRLTRSALTQASKLFFRGFTQTRSAWAAWRQKRRAVLAARTRQPAAPSSEEQARLAREAAIRAQAESDAQRRRVEARTRCELFYARHLPEIRKRFSRATFDAYLKRHLGDEHAPEYVEQRAVDLLDLLESHVARIDPSRQRRSVEELVRWHQSARAQIQALPLNPDAIETLLTNLDSQFDDLIRKAIEEIQP